MKWRSIDILLTLPHERLRNFQSVTTEFSSEEEAWLVKKRGLRSFRNRVVEKEDFTLVDST